MSEETELNDFADRLGKLTVLEMAKLKKILEEKWGVQATVAAAAPAATVIAEPTEFKVTLAKAPADKKIALIKAVREITGLALKEARDVVENAPTVLKESIGKKEAEDIATKIRAAGGSVELVGA